MKHSDLLVPPGERFSIKHLDAGYTCDFERKDDAVKKLRDDIVRLTKLQDRLYAEDRHALLIVFQGMDAAGKDGAIKHVMSGVNPQGVHVYAFRQPTPEERAHDFLWRCVKVLPARGRIGIFNRSYYEELVTVRVHPELLEEERLPTSDLATIWRDRFEDVNAFEHHLVRNGTIIVKCFLHISQEEQRRRLLARLDEPDKIWKIFGDILVATLKQLHPKYPRFEGDPALIDEERRQLECASFSERDRP